MLNKNIILIMAFGFYSITYSQNDTVFIPIESKNRLSVKEITLTNIGDFGLMRKARKNIPAHYHTGIDINRPNENYANSKIYPIANGVVISMRCDGPFAQIIIEHTIHGKTIWSVYEHVSGITVNVGDNVSPHNAIARFMNRDELNKYGWQFNHLHLEILKEKPVAIKYDNKNTQRFYNTYALICYTKDQLERYYFNALQFIFMINN